MCRPGDATVSDILQMMAQLEAEGFRHYVVTCNDEYALAKKGDTPEVKPQKLVIDLGGYDS